MQVERTDSLELIPIPRKASGSVSQNNRKALKQNVTLPIKENSCGREPPPPDSHGYSPMDGGGSTGGVPANPYNYNPREPLLSRGPSKERGKAQPPVSNGGSQKIDPADLAPKVSSSLLTAGNTGNSPYVPPGYIMLDHCDNTTVATLSMNDYVPSSVWICEKTRAKRQFCVTTTLVNSDLSWQIV